MHVRIYVCIFLVCCSFMPLALLHVCVASDIFWSKLVKKQCHANKYPKSYDTFESAQEACAALGDQCTGVYDIKCDGAGKYKLCKPGPIKPSEKSCVYTPGMYSCMHVSLYGCV